MAFGDELGADNDVHLPLADGVELAIKFVGGVGLIAIKAGNPGVGETPLQCLLDTLGTCAGEEQVCNTVRTSLARLPSIAAVVAAELISMIRAHMDVEETELDNVEGRGALNFLTIDDIKVTEEGELVDATSIIKLPTKADFPLIPDISRNLNDPFLQLVNASGQHWVVLADEQGDPKLLLDADAALRAALLDIGKPYDIYNYCRRSLVIRNASETIGDVISYLKSLPGTSRLEDSAIDYDVVLVWTDSPRIITGSDILGKLLKGIKADFPVTKVELTTKPKIKLESDANL